MTLFQNKIYNRDDTSAGQLKSREQHPDLIKFLDAIALMLANNYEKSIQIQCKTN